MFAPGQYELLDFGNGRKLERFASELLDRPSPAAENIPVTRPELWGDATARFEVAGRGKGSWDREIAEWSVGHRNSRLVMDLRASGNIGIFPEQANNWDWIAKQIAQGRELAQRSPRVLNLFAYTGGASLAAAGAGAEVTHVDSSGPTVAWAKRNAEASEMVDLPIRWIVEDAIKFVAREVRRGNHYDGIIADPPTYGHGPKGRAFKFGEHVGELMELCGDLLRGSDAGHGFFLFSCHAPGVGAADAASMVDGAMGDVDGGRTTSRPLTLETADGRSLSAGVSARWSATREF